jgi:hypothetical protein
MSTLHDDEIRDIFARFERERAAQSEASTRVQADRVEFLRQFNDAASNIILPVFVEINQKSPQVLGVRAYPRHDYSIYTAEYAMSLGGDDRRSLIFKADSDKMRVTISHNVPSGRQSDKDVKLEDITSDFVEQELVIFLRSALKAR